MSGHCERSMYKEHKGVIPAIQAITMGISQYFTMPLISHGIHVEQIYSMWNPWNPHGIHMKYVLPHKSCTH